MTNNKEKDGPSKDFSWIVCCVDAAGGIRYVDASQGFHDTDMLGSFFLEDLMWDDTPAFTNCIFKVEPSIDPDDCTISWNDKDVEILYQYSRGKMLSKEK